MRNRNRNHNPNRNLPLLKDLIRWFRKNKRDLPWRKNRTSYSVWISEIMLQQTTVKAVIPFYEKWMKRFPDVRSVAKASEQEILRMWEGLGYYTRAKNILKAAKIISAQFQGQFPDDYRDVIKLPGIGPYTAGAILSIAFQKLYPVMDANVRRVGRRILGLVSWDKKKEQELLNFLKGMIPQKNPGEFNEGIMELGQTVCIAERPLCDKCPLTKFCIGFKKNIQDLIPGKATRKITEKKTFLALIVSQGKLLIVKRNKGLLKDIWGFPEFQEQGQIASFIKKEGGVDFAEIGKLKARVHHYTKFRDELSPFVYRVKKPFGRNTGNRRWVAFKDLENYPFPSIYRKILDELSLIPFHAKI